MGITARQSTARTLIVGPVLDADGVAVTGSVVADFKISKNGAAPAALDGSATLTHRHTGMYSLALTANDLDTVGSAQVTCDDTVNACPVADITVIEEVIYDALFAATANAFAGAAGSTTLTALASGSITAAVIATGAIDADAIADNAIDAGAIAADAITAAKIANGAIDAATFAADVDAEILSYLVDDATRIDASALNTAAVTSIPAILVDTNELQTDWVDGGRLDLIIDAILVDTGTTLDGKIDTIDGIVDTILVDTNELQTDWVNGGRLDLLLDATLADTNELQTDWANGGRLDLIVDAILDDTDLIDDGTSGLAKIATDVAAILVDTGTTLDGKINTIDTVVDAIQAKTDNLPADPAGLADLASAHGAGSWTTADVSDLPTNTELATALDGIPKVGQSHRYTNDDTSVSADVSISEVP